jgi:hypothetical protein
MIRNVQGCRRYSQVTARMMTQYARRTLDCTMVNPVVKEFRWESKTQPARWSKTGWSP